MQSVQVEIFGQQYSIRGQEDPTHIRDLASFVDAKMKEVQKGTGTADPHRVAILTALTISAELYRLREQYAALQSAAGKSLQNLLDLTSPLENP